MLKKIRNGGFVLVEFAIALPLLILVMYGLANVGVKIFELGKIQLADYVLESEAHYVMERITQEARAAKKIVPHNDLNQIKIIYHAVDNSNDFYSEFDNLHLIKDVSETRFIFPYKKEGRIYPNLYAERQETARNNPITGDNFFGETKINTLQYDLDESKKILHIELEMESLETEHKIKIATAVFMPGYEVPSDE